MKNSQRKNTVWQQLIDGKLNCKEAIKRIVDEEGNLYSFRNAAIAKLQQGITTVEEIQRVLPRAVLQTSA